MLRHPGRPPAHPHPSRVLLKGTVMTHPIAAEYELREIARETSARAMRARLIELASCCKPSRVKAALSRVRNRLTPAAPCCA